MAFIISSEDAGEEYDDYQYDYENPFPTASEKAATVSVIAHRNTPFSFNLIHTMHG
jgi:hypothetical protein